MTLFPDRKRYTFASEDSNARIWRAPLDRLSIIAPNPIVRSRTSAQCGRERAYDDFLLFLSTSQSNAVRIFPFGFPSVMSYELLFKSAREILNVSFCSPGVFSQDTGRDQAAETPDLAIFSTTATVRSRSGRAASSSPHPMSSLVGTRRTSGRWLARFLRRTAFSNPLVTMRKARCREIATSRAALRGRATVVVRDRNGARVSTIR